jgi:hypothetical protein
MPAAEQVVQITRRFGTEPVTDEEFTVTADGDDAVPFSRVFSGFSKKMVGATGFEPATSCSQSKCSSQAELRSGAASYSQELASTQSESH